jgi:hypothetical protein
MIYLPDTNVFSAYLSDRYKPLTDDFIGLLSVSLRE